MTRIHEEEVIGPNGEAWTVMLKEDLENLKKGIIPQMELPEGAFDLDSQWVVVGWKEVYELLWKCRLKKEEERLRRWQHEQT